MLRLIRLLCACVVAVVALIAASSLSGSAQARVQKIFAFPGGAGGWFPFGPLVIDAGGNLYGTTNAGGMFGCGGFGCGTAFKLTPGSSSYALTTIHTFGSAQDGGTPVGGLIADATGALYGTTEYRNGSFGGGTVFKLTPTASGYAESVLHTFQALADGVDPAGGVIADSSGALYGATTQGGGDASCGCGTVFKLTPSARGYNETVIYSFRGGRNGSQPHAGLVEDGNGNLYGSTWFGGGPGCSGNGCGIIFKLTPKGSGYVESVIHRFAGVLPRRCLGCVGNDGAFPTGALTLDASGRVYGATLDGGTGCKHNGCGIVFSLIPNAAGYNERILYQFKEFAGGRPDGVSPTGNLMIDARGAIYGTTAYDGLPACLVRGLSCGTIFKLTPTGSWYSESVLYLFKTEVGDDVMPGLVPGRDGAFYGVAGAGGNPACNGIFGGCGTVFRLTL